jgi:uncharacterized protein YjbJ (UPF0337 family)
MALNHSHAPTQGEHMSTFRRKGNWNEIAGTLKHQVADPTDKDLKKGKKKELSERLSQKFGKTKSQLLKPIAKTK